MKEFVNFPVQLDTELHSAVKASAFASNLSMQQLLILTLRDIFIVPGKVTIYKTRAMGKTEVRHAESIMD